MQNPGTGEVPFYGAVAQLGARMNSVRAICEVEVRSLSAPPFKRRLKAQGPRLEDGGNPLRITIRKDVVPCCRSENKGSKMKEKGES